MVDTFFVILHGDPETSNLYWTGYDREHKDHRFSRDLSQAVRFCRLVDAEKAGVGLAKGVRYGEREWPPETGR